MLFCIMKNKKLLGEDKEKAKGKRKAELFFGAFLCEEKKNVWKGTRMKTIFQLSLETPQLLRRLTLVRKTKLLCRLTEAAIGK